MAQSPQNLFNARVRIVLRRNFREMPIDIMRGVVTDVSNCGITISGRHFQEFRDSVSAGYDERPLADHTKVYFIPFNSLKYIDVILPGSQEAKLADKIENNPVAEPVKEYAFSPVVGKKAK